MRYAVVKDKKVINIIEAEKGFVSDGLLLVASEKANIGWVYENGAFIEPEASEYTPTYAELREKEYPPIADYLDAKVKQASDDANIVAAGEEQEAAYLAACLAVKAKHPKQ